MRAGSGTPIHACRSGEVVIAGSQGGYGNAVVVNHGGGMATLYAHQSQIAASVGQQVAAGDVIGYVGSTGMSTGPHLHFEVRLSGNPVDPAPYLS
jgi:murein DD-endopeptidase MepM/ murein hydrolase activator NlpD